MTSDHVALVRRAYELWNREGPRAIGPMLSPDAEVHDAPQLPDAEIWKGRDAVVARLEAVAEAMGGGYVEFDGFTPCTGAVLVAMRWELGSETGHAELGEVFHLVDVDAGLITRIRVFLTEAEALGAT